MGQEDSPTPPQEPASQRSLTDLPLLRTRQTAGCRAEPRARRRKPSVKTHGSRRDGDTVPVLRRSIHGNTRPQLRAGLDAAADITQAAMLAGLL